MSTENTSDQIVAEARTKKGIHALLSIWGLSYVLAAAMGAGAVAIYNNHQAQKANEIQNDVQQAVGFASGLNIDDYNKREYGSTPKIVRISEDASTLMIYVDRALQSNQASSGQLDNLMDSLDVAKNADLNYPDYIRVRFDRELDAVAQQKTVINKKELGDRYPKVADNNPTP